MNIVHFSPGDGETDQSSESLVLTTGKVVGVLERCWRNYVATLPEEDEVKHFYHNSFINKSNLLWYNIAYVTIYQTCLNFSFRKEY